jgi:hypothetical protein
MAVREWIRRLFLSTSRDDEAALREEYHPPERPEADVRQATLHRSPGGEAGEDDLETLRRPPDPDP